MEKLTLAYTYRSDPRDDIAESLDVQTEWGSEGMTSHEAFMRFGEFLRGCGFFVETQQ